MKIDITGHQLPFQFIKLTIDYCL